LQLQEGKEVGEDAKIPTGKGKAVVLIVLKKKMHMLFIKTEVTVMDSSLDFSTKLCALPGCRSLIWR
jgi:hypothetical protein